MGCLKLSYYNREEALEENPLFIEKGLGKNWYAEKNRVSAYRYGFNGMEKDDEIKGTGNSLDFGARIYDPRVGTWLAVDPLRRKYPCISPYNFAANNPINLRDPDGNILIDANGNIIYSSNGKFGPEPDDPTEEGLVVEFTRTEIVTIYGNNGQPIEALIRTRVRKYYTNVVKYDEQTNTSHIEQVWTTEIVEGSENEAYDCHGYTFLGGNLWLDSERLIDLLEADGYFEAGEKTEGEKGDITVYCNEGVYTHSGVIIEGGQIRSKWGNGALKETTEKEIFEYETADGERYGDQKEIYERIENQKISTDELKTGKKQGSNGARKLKKKEVKKLKKSGVIN